MPMPALFTTMSTRPSSAKLRSAKSRICSASATSTRALSTRRPMASMRSDVSLRPASSTSQIARSAPRSAIARAVARPMPLAAPVTAATLPERFLVSMPAMIVQL